MLIIIAYIPQRLHVLSHRQSSLSACYRKQESLKKRAYEQRVREVEHSSFTPLVLSATGGMANEATTFYKSTRPRIDRAPRPPKPIVIINSLTIIVITKVYSRSVDPRKLRVGVKYYVIHSCKHKKIFFFFFFFF